jgi:hypothetical protein
MLGVRTSALIFSTTYTSWGGYLRTPGASVGVYLRCEYGTSVQRLTLVHFSAQFERFIWDRVCA